jgi:hypothetical protein
MRHKSESFEKFKEFQNEVQNQLGKIIKFLRSHRRGEYLSLESKCQSCVHFKQPRKPHKAAEDRHLAPIELIHSDICEINSVLTEGGQRYFMTMIDDASRYYYVYLLKTKDDTLNYFKTYKAKVENQLEKRSNILGLIVVVNISLMSSTYSVQNIVLYMRGCHPIHSNQTGLPNERIAH